MTVAPVPACAANGVDALATTPASGADGGGCAGRRAPPRRPRRGDARSIAMLGRTERTVRPGGVRGSPPRPMTGATAAGENSGSITGNNSAIAATVRHLPHPSLCGRALEACFALYALDHTATPSNYGSAPTRQHQASRHSSPIRYREYRHTISIVSYYRSHRQFHGPVKMTVRTHTSIPTECDEPPEHRLGAARQGVIKALLESVDVASVRCRGVRGAGDQCAHLVRKPRHIRPINVLGELSHKRDECRRGWRTCTHNILERVA